MCIWSDSSPHNLSDSVLMPHRSLCHHFSLHLRAEEQRWWLQRTSSAVDTLPLLSRRILFWNLNFSTQASAQRENSHGEVSFCTHSSAVRIPQSFQPNYESLCSVDLSIFWKEFICLSTYKVGCSYRYKRAQFRTPACITDAGAWCWVPEMDNHKSCL